MGTLGQGDRGFYDAEAWNKGVLFHPPHLWLIHQETPHFPHRDSSKDSPAAQQNLWLLGIGAFNHSARVLAAPRLLAAPLLLPTS